MWIVLNPKIIALLECTRECFRGRLKDNCLGKGVCIFDPVNGILYIDNVFRDGC